MHSLNGTLGNIISYNVELEGGVGTLLQENQWTKVGTIEFDVINQTASKEITWLGLDQFPPTVIYNLVGAEKELLQPNFIDSTQPTQNVDLVQAVTRSWQHPCTENGGWIKLTWQNIPEYETMAISTNGGASFTTVPNTDEEYVVENLRNAEKINLPI